MNMKTRVCAACTAALLLMTLLAGCGAAAKEKTFSNAGLSITLTEDFAEKDIASFTNVYLSLDSTVMILKEEFTLFEQAGLDASSVSLDDYAALVLANNNKTETPAHEDGLTYFEFSSTANGKEMSYLAVVFQGSDAFWTVQFACESSNYQTSRAQFMQYAKTVVVD